MKGKCYLGDTTLIVCEANSQAEVGQSDGGEETCEGKVHPDAEANEDDGQQGVQEEGKLQAFQWKPCLHQ